MDPDSIGAPGTAKNLLTVVAAESDRAPGSGMALAFTNVAHYAIHALMAGFPSNAFTV